MGEILRSNSTLSPPLSSNSEHFHSILDVVVRDLLPFTPRWTPDGGVKGGRNLTVYDEEAGAEVERRQHVHVLLMGVDLPAGHQFGCPAHGCK